MVYVLVFINLKQNEKKVKTKLIFPTCYILQQIKISATLNLTKYLNKAYKWLFETFFVMKKFRNQGDQGNMRKNPRDTAVFRG